MTTATKTIPKGYKQTEIGVIPSDWETKSLADLAAYVTVGFVGSMSHLFLDYGVPLLRGTNIQPGRIDFNDLKYISKGTHHLWKKSSLGEGDIVIVRVGYPGTAAVVSVGLGDLNAASLVVVRINPKIGVSDYVCYVLNSEWGRGEIQNLLVGGAQQVFNIGTASAFKIGIPKGIAEQKLIASALSDADALIEKLTKLIEKKKNIKQGAMQELLTGKRRLPGFSGKWEEKELVEIANFYDNFRIPVTESKREYGLTQYYGANGIQGYIKGYTHDGEFVLIAEDGANDLNNYPVLYVNGKVWVNNHAHVIQGIDGCTKTKYLSYALKTVNFVQVLVGGTRAKLNGSVAKAIKILIPIDIAEQSAITTALSDMDEEIERLESQLSKYQNLKQGMMQTLLTGKIRLI